MLCSCSQMVEQSQVRVDTQPADAHPLVDARATETAVPAEVGTDSAFGPASVLTGHLHATRDGAHVDVKITRASAAALSMDQSFHATYDGQTWSQPLYIDGYKPGRDAVFVATQTNEVAAFDAMTGATLWSVNLGTPVPPANLPCTQPLNQTYGIQSTPAIDEASRTLFTDAFVTVGDDGATEKHLVFALSIDDGSIRAGWPVDVAAAVDGFSAIVQHQRGSLLVVNGIVYITYYGIEYDCEPPTYHGRVIGISMADPTHVISWAVPANRGGIWGAVASDGTSLFVSTGNTYTPGGIPDAGQTWGGGEAVIRLTQDLVFTGDTTSFFTPSNWQTLDMRDYDLGSSSPVLLDVPGANPSSLIVAMGKAGVAHLLDRSNLGGIGTGNGSTGEGLFSAALVLPAEGMKGNPAAYTTAQGQYVVFRGDAVATGCPGDASAGDLVALKILPTSPPSFSVAWCATSQGLGSPMVTTTDGQSNPIVWVASAQGSNLLLGFDGDTGAAVFTGGGATMTQVLRWTSPIVAKGRFYVGATGQLFAFGVP